MPEPELRLVSRGEPVDVDDLMRRAARGDSQAFEGLYDELSPAVYGLARRVVRDPARAEDVTQEVFLAVWRKACESVYERARGEYGAEAVNQMLKEAAAIRA